MRARGESPEPQKPTTDPNTRVKPEAIFHREVDGSNLPSQYTEDIETRQVLNIPDPRDSMPMSSTSAGSKWLKNRSPSAMVPVGHSLKEALDKFKQDFQAANLPGGKFINSPPSTAKWYKLGQLVLRTKYKNLILIFQKSVSPPRLCS